MFWRNLSDEEKRKVVETNLPELPLCLFKDASGFLGGFLHPSEADPRLWEHESALEGLAILISSLNEIEEELTHTVGNYPVAHGLLQDEHRKLRKHMGLLPYEDDEMDDLLDDVVEAEIDTESPN